MGWNRAVQAARFCDTWVLVEGDAYEAEIRRWLAEHGPVEGLEFVFVRQPQWQKLLARFPGGYYLAYNLWHRQALGVARRLHREIHFDLAHQSTFCGFREPGYVAGLGVPVVWGPVGGTQNYPLRFLWLAGLVGGGKELARSIVNTLQLRFKRRVHRAASSAAAFIVISESVARAFRRVCGIESEVLPDCGVAELRTSPRVVDLQRKTLRILWSGNLIPLKALPVLLHALALVSDQLDFELRVLGDGPYRRAYERLTRRLGLGTRVTFFGRLPMDQALAQRAWADVFVFSSLRDSAGTVVVEALADGLPVISFDHQGVADMVTTDCGIKIPVTTPRQAFRDFADALLRCAADRQLLQSQSDAAVRRARVYHWPQHGMRMATVYRRILGEDFYWDDDLVPRSCLFGHREQSLPVPADLVGAAP